MGLRLSRRTEVIILRHMPKISAGLLMYRVRGGELEFLLAHPGGPFWKDRDAGAWTIPKGELQPGEEPLVAAMREFQEEIGLKPEGEFDTTRIQSNTFQMEWPPRSGKFQTCPEVDRASFYGMAEAKQKINPAQVGFLEELQQLRGKI